MLKILMIEDDLELAELLCERLESSDMSVVVALTPLDGLKLLVEQRFDMLVLDLSLPQMDGLQICRLIRQDSTIPIIISSARSDMRDKNLAFLAGADDFLPKPYDPQELIYRIGAVMRRVSPVTLGVTEPFEVDEQRREILKNGTPLSLTKAEYEIVFYMLTHAVVSREELLLNISSIKYESSLKSIDVIMGRIRQKIGDDTKNPHYIVAVRGIGYRFVNR